MEIVLATNNLHKQAEMQAMLAPGFEFVLESALPDVVEDGVTYEANAIKKAEAAAIFTGEPSLAEDSGFEVIALDNIPGLHSARFVSPEAPPRQKMQAVLDLLEGKPSGARFVSVVAFAVPDKDTVVFRGTWGGTVSDSIRGPREFGYEQLFCPEGYGTMTCSMLSYETKNRVSHRAIAMKQLNEFLRSTS